MSRIRSKDTKPELVLRRALWHAGFRYRKNYKALPGTPDIAITKHKVAVFCDGEFFHGQYWKDLEMRLQKTNNSEYWIGKIRRNMRRDDEVNKKLRFEGWTVIRFWGKEIMKDPDGCVEAIREIILDGAIE